jgi:putrescine aminotransferase
MYANSIVDLDRAHLIHPVASWRGHEKAGVRLLQSGKGALVIDAAGRQLVDGFSGLWCVNAGYGHESIVEAASRQMRELPYATGYFGLGSEPAARLAAELADRTPGDLTTCTSRSVARTPWTRQCGSFATTIAPRASRSTTSSSPWNRATMALPLSLRADGAAGVSPGVWLALPLAAQDRFALSLPQPATTDADIIAASVAALKSKVAEIGSDRVAALFAEPIQGSGGVIVPPSGWMKAMRNTCRDLGILFVADEVITGFGRTGPLFASSEDDIVPDLMTVAKGLTSGYAPMGAVFLTEHVYQTIADGAGASPVGHGFTYSAHPVSAAVGLEVLRLYERAACSKWRAMGARLQDGLNSLRDHPLVGDVRGRGMLAAVELVTDKEAKTPLPGAAESGRRIFDRAWDNGLIIRAFAQGVLALHRRSVARNRTSTPLSSGPARSST